jgi:hypothetical protein
VDRSAVPDVKNIRLAGESCPEWIDQCAGYATLHNGRLSGIAFLTTGRGVEKAVTASLREKYGPPTRVVSGRVIPDVGNPFNTNEPEWSLPGLFVEYEVVLREEGEDERISTKQGIVRIMTESERARRIAKQKAKPKPKL